MVFPTPVAIAANTTYVISYLAPNGHYSGPDDYFATAGVDNPPLHALRNGVDGPNGVYMYSAASVFPTDTFQSEGYFVDVVFNTTIGPDMTAPAVKSVNPFAGASGVLTTTNVSGHLQRGDVIRRRSRRQRLPAHADEHGRAGDRLVLRRATNTATIDPIRVARVLARLTPAS